MNNCNTEIWLLLMDCTSFFHSFTQATSPMSPWASLVTSNSNTYCFGISFCIFVMTVRKKVYYYLWPSNATWRQSFGSKLLPGGTKQLPGPMLIFRYWGSMSFNGDQCTQWDRKLLIHIMNLTIIHMYFKVTATSSWSQWFKNISNTNETP